jgi:hypothetical protein
MTKITLSVGMTAASLMFLGVLLCFAAIYSDEDLPRLFDFGFELAISSMGIVIMIIFIELLGHVFWPKRFS